jgi:hypothetical protein
MPSKDDNAPTEPKAVTSLPERMDAGKDIVLENMFCMSSGKWSWSSECLPSS